MAEVAGSLNRFEKRELDANGLATSID